MSHTAIQLVASNHPVLHRGAERVVNLRKQVIPYFAAMQQLMRAAPGIGLAAPQVGISLRFFVTAIVDPPGLEVVVNPILEQASPDMLGGTEGCLSFPGVVCHVLRHASIVVSFNDGTGYRTTMALSAYAARVFQHELDHLNGICIVDKHDQRL